MLKSQRYRGLVSLVIANQIRQLKTADQTPLSKFGRWIADCAIVKSNTI